MSDDNGELRELVAEVAAAYFSNSHVSVADIPNVLSQIATSLAAVNSRQASPLESAAPVQVIDEGLAEPAHLLPSAAAATAGEVRRSISDDGLVSFEDGRRYKTLKRHLTTRGLTPDAYRQKWGLPSDYPMVCADSSAKRSALAKLNGLGQKLPPRVRKAVPSLRLAKRAANA
jgi:predicted transcriptional regulator